MNRTKLHLATLIIVLCVQSIYAFSAAAQESDSDETQLRHLKTVLWPKAYREQDTALLDRILHPSFRRINAEGDVSDKAGELARIRASKPSYTSFRFEIERLEVFDGKFAVVSGTGVIQNEDKEGKTETRYRSSNHLIKVDGVWRAISSHVSGVKTTRLGR